jgi:hypothetical protein
MSPKIQRRFLDIYSVFSFSSKDRKKKEIGPTFRKVKLFHMYFFEYRRGTNCRLPESSFWRKVIVGCYFGSTELEDEFS